jgi:hypothetical protein
MEAGGRLIIPERRIVSYFDHEFLEPSARKLEADVAEMTNAEFTQVVLCVTETDVRSRERQAYLMDAVETMQASGLDVWADPWAVGGVFGGEGISHFKRRHERHCDCNPHLERLLDRWLETVVQLGAKTVFWDEPEMHCREHLGGEIEFIDKYTQKAGALALQNVVCLSANRRKRSQLEEIAAMSAVAELATDPYYPNAFTRIPEAQRLEYVATWAHETKMVADTYGKRSHMWVQNFGIPEGRENIINEHIAIARTEGIDVAVWGFHGCESVPNFITPDQASSRTMWKTTIGALALRRMT